MKNEYTFEDFRRECLLPHDHNIKLWRYMDLAKFLSLLDKRALFFTQTNKFEDPYEGVFPQSVMKERIERLIDPNDYRSMMLMAIRKDTDEEFRRKSYISCWHMSERESYAMWKLYLRGEHGVAIQTTSKKLIKHLNTKQRVNLCKVKYIDHETDYCEDYPLAQLSVKPYWFSYEQELRAIVLDQELDPNQPKEKLERNEYGLYIPMENINEIIENIYISPASPEWFKDLVQSILLNKYGITKEIQQSVLSREPQL